MISKYFLEYQIQVGIIELASFTTLSISFTRCAYKFFISDVFICGPTKL